MNKLFLFITLILAVVTVIAAPPPPPPSSDPTKSQGEGGQTSSLDGAANANQGNGQTQSYEEIDEKCKECCKAYTGYHTLMCFAGCRSHYARCNKPQC